MKVFCFDSETSGLPDFKKPADDPSQPRIVQLAGALFEADAADPIQMSPPPIKAFCEKIKPDGWRMDDALAEKLGNGLTHAVLDAEGKPAAQVLQMWADLHDAADLIVGFNITFDLKMMRCELRRAAMDDRYGARPTFDVLPPCTARCKIPPTEKMMAAGRRHFKTPNLSEAVSIILGDKHVGAHDAMNDVYATYRLFRLVYHPDAVKPIKPATPKPQSAPVKAPDGVPDFLA
jgi:DNA polymerase-3 subunit epsilon